MVRKRESNLTRGLKETSMRVKIAPVAGLVIIGILTLAMAVPVFAANENPVQTQSAGRSAVSGNQQDSEPVYVVTPVLGPSWLKLIGIFDIRFTAMGHMGGDGTPPRSPRVEPDFPVAQTPPRGRMGMGGKKCLRSVTLTKKKQTPCCNTCDSGLESLNRKEKIFS
jgi:hypothetical protein